MEFCNLASGSKGNATYIHANNTSILIDNGLSYSGLVNRAKEVGIDLSSLDAVFITHEHIDHVKGVDKLTQNLGIPVYIHPKSLSKARCKFGSFAYAVETEFPEPITIKDLTISAFRVSHDAEMCHGFSITDGNKVLTMATDLGHITDPIFKRLTKSDYIFIESNYDRDFLFDGNYPYRTKVRIDSNKGHLSNEQSSNAITRLVKEFNKKRFMLAHISQNNNTRQRVLQTLENTLKENNIDISSLDVLVASQDEPTGIIEV